MDPVTILCADLRSKGVIVPPDIMRAAIAATGLTLAGGAKQAVQSHLAEVRRLSSVLVGANA